MLESGRWIVTDWGQTKSPLRDVAMRYEKPLHVACVSTGNDRRCIYLDGHLVQSDSRGAMPSDFHLDTTLNIADGLIGTIDEIRLSTCARYQKDFNPIQRHRADRYTVALYHCDEGQGDVLIDSSGNDHHGKIVGGRHVLMTQPIE